MTERTLNPRDGEGGSGGTRLQDGDPAREVCGYVRNGTYCKTTATWDKAQKVAESFIRGPTPNMQGITNDPPSIPTCETPIILAWL